MQKHRKYKLEFIYKAIESFGGSGKYKNVFNTAGYQFAVQKEFGLEHPLDPRIARNHLLNTKNIKELSGGCHWKKIK